MAILSLGLSDRRTSRWGGPAALVTLVLFVGTRAGAQTTPVTPESEVKAAYLLNFARYVEWPVSAFADSDSPITICVVGADPFGSTLDQTVNQRRVQGRSIRIERMLVPEENPRCHIAFLVSLEDLPRALRLWRGRPVLLVGEGSAFAAGGGTIAFVPADETVRFEINAGAAKAGGLQISSRVLALATRVYAAAQAR